MDFSEVLRQAITGEKIFRKEWENKKYVTKLEADGFGNPPTLCLHTEPAEYSPPLTDLMAEDWEIEPKIVY